MRRTSEFQASEAMQARATERARWAAVLARPAGVKPATRVRRSLWSLLFGF